MANSHLPLKSFIARAAPRLERLYGRSQAPLLLDEIVSILQHHAAGSAGSEAGRWSEGDVVLITYGDSVGRTGEIPLATLDRFLRKYLDGLVSAVHLLPFFPYSSDDGFSVIDYTKVDPELGGWEDVEAIGERFDLMVDLVLNHVSRESLWFVDFINARPPACYYFLEIDPSVDLSDVVRPRKGRVLTPVHTHRGLKHVWSTFSEDQIDLNFANPNVLLEFLRILLLYLRRGARYIRLDAVAFLWKKLGTRCLNLPQTHEVVKLLRDVLDAVAPRAVLITETNLPHEENVSYFGGGDEAHMIYQFTLAPLLLHALYRGTGRHLSAWARQRCEAPPGCTFLNFTASHDGIGLRPAEGILSEGEVAALVDAMQGFGGFVSMKSNKDGSDSPYEINISLFDALKGNHRGVDQWQVPRFLCSQAVMLSLKGIPALYIHSLTASPNDLVGVGRTGRTRSINRRKWDFDELSGLLDSPVTPNGVVYRELQHLLKIRRRQSAFHPDASQEVLDLGDEVFALRRFGGEGGQTIVAVSNLTDVARNVSLREVLPEARTPRGWTDLISGAPLQEEPGVIALQPYQSVWITDLVV